MFYKLFLFFKQDHLDSNSLIPPLPRERGLGGEAFLLLALLVCPLLAAPPAHPDKIAYPTFKWSVPKGENYRYELQNGMILFVTPDFQLPRVQISIATYGGSLWDPAGKEGLAQFAAGLMRTGGTTKIPANTLDELLERYAISLDVAASENQIVASGSSLARFCDTTMTLLAQIIQNPAFEKAKIDQERTNFLEDIAHRFDNPSPILNVAYTKALYPNQANSALSTQKSILSITRDDLTKFTQRYFYPANMIVTVTGACSIAHAIEMMEKLFPAKATQPRFNMQCQVAPTLKPQVLVVQKKITQAYIKVGLPTFKRPASDFYALSLLDQILGGDAFTSRLGSRIRSDEGLTYSIHSAVGSNYLYPATWVVSFFTKSATANKALSIVKEEIAKINVSGVTQKELDDAKSVLLNEFPDMFRTPADIARNYAFNEYWHRSPDHFAKYPDSINAVTLSEIARVAKLYIDPKKLSYVCVGDTGAIFAGDTSAGFSLRSMYPKVVSVDSLGAMK